MTASTLQMRGGNDLQAKYAKLYRADSIVKDCEAIRKILTADYPEARKKWSTVGQSFGGFITTSYLSFHPEGLRESFVFGGLQPLVTSPDEVYRRLYKKVIQRNEAYYAKYPEDVAKVKAVMRYLSRFGDGKIKLPSEGTLSRRRFRQIGILLGFHGGLDMGTLRSPTSQYNRATVSERLRYARFHRTVGSTTHPLTQVSHVYSLWVNPGEFTY